MENEAALYSLTALTCCYLPKFSASMLLGRVCQSVCLSVCDSFLLFTITQKIIHRFTPNRHSS